MMEPRDTNIDAPNEARILGEFRFIYLFQKYPNWFRKTISTQGTARFREKIIILSQIFNQLIFIFEKTSLRQS